MKYLVLALAIMLCLCASAYGALDAAIEWNVTTGGNNGHGGGFKNGASGTDYSLQDEEHQFYSDLVIDGADDTKLTSVGAPFAADDVGNILRIASGTGFTPGPYEVVSVAASVATMDRAVGTVGSTGGAGNLGGALLTLTRAEDGPIVPGNTVWVQSGTYAEKLTVDVDGTANFYIHYKGYQTTHGDAPTGDDRPLIDATGETNGIILAGDIHRAFWYLRVANATSTGISTSSSSTALFFEVKISNNGASGLSAVSSSHAVVIGCESTGNSSDGFIVSGSDNSAILAIASVAYGNTSEGFQSQAETVGTQANIFIDCLAYENSDTGFELGVGGAVVNCSSFDNTGASTDGFKVDPSGGTGNTFTPIINSIADDNGRKAFNQPTNDSSIMLAHTRGNDYGGGTTNTNRHGPSVTTADSTAAIIDAANDDYGLTVWFAAYGARFPNTATWKTIGAAQPPCLKTGGGGP